jgi:hypothetical protein
MWSLVGSFQLKERMWMLNSGFTFFTKIKVFANRALIADSDNWAFVTSVTDIAFMNHFAFFAFVLNLRINRDTFVS